MPRKGWIRAAQAVLAIAVIALAARQVRHEWRRLDGVEVTWSIDWMLVIASMLVTWTMYLMLIHAWRAVLQGWGDRLPLGTAIRIWFVSSLGKYVPGKLWALGAMAVMAERAGVSGAAATASSVIMQLVSITTGLGVAVVLLGGEQVAGSVQLGQGWLVAAAAAAIAGTALLASARVMGMLGKLIGRPGAVRPVGGVALVQATIPSLIAWLGYGTSLFLLVRGTLPDVTLTWATATGAFAASYIAGYLMVLAPGGLGVREGALVLLLGPAIGPANALAVAFASRLTLTINELAPALPMLLLGRPVRDVS